jgi:hypothetical protein
MYIKSMANRPIGPIWTNEFDGPNYTDPYTYQCLPATWDYQLWQRKDNDIGVVIDQNSNNFFNRAENKQKT